MTSLRDFTNVNWGHFTPNQSPRLDIFDLFPALNQTWEKLCPQTRVLKFQISILFIYKNFSLKYNIKEHIPTRKGIDLNVDTLFWCFIYNVIRKLFKYTKCPQFPGKCLQSRFAGFAAFLMSAHNLERLNTVNISYTNISKCYLKYLNILISNCEFDFICKILSKIETDSLPYKSFGAQSPVVMWWYL